MSCKKYIMKLKSKLTLYLDEDDCWVDEDPRWYGNQRKDILRKGSVLYMYYCNDIEKFPDEPQVILLTKENRGGIVFLTSERAVGWDWFDILEDRR